jgi:hypothetical protein
MPEGLERTREVLGRVWSGRRKRPWFVPLERVLTTRPLQIRLSLGPLPGQRALIP